MKRILTIYCVCVVTVIVNLDVFWWDKLPKVKIVTTIITYIPDNGSLSGYDIGYNCTTNYTRLW